MPGRLVMEIKEPQALGSLKRDGSHLARQSDGPDQKRVASDASRAKLNGLPQPPNLVLATTPVTNGVDSSHHNVSLENKGEGKAHGGHHEAVDAPEIEKFRDTLVPFGEMITRMAQGAYFELSETIESLADMNIESAPPMVNGTSSHANQDKSRQSVAKKLRLLQFAQDQKDRFIKALVLSDWARNMDDMSKLIDVSMFLRKQDWATHSAADSLYRMKDNMVAAKMPNPNIEGALEILATGEAPWMPDLGYIPPKPLTARELLDALADMNVALSVRINLHEELPPHFRNYRIDNGRATFVVAGEYEVDLAIADEDPESPFYFIDLRLLFDPVASLNSDRLRNQLEARTNEALATSGLSGCYEFLHNFVLTHKLNILRCQALDLARGKWIDNIDVQAIHRSVVVQYWKKQGGAKHWIELGIGRGRSAKHSTSRLEPPSQIQCRWFRRGQEVPTHDLLLDTTSLSMESFLEQVVAKHCAGRLGSTYAALGHLAGSKRFSSSFEGSDRDAGDSHLDISMRNLDVGMTISTDPIRGTFVVQPQRAIARDLQRRLNGDHGVDAAAAAIRHDLCRGVLARIEERTQKIGWRRLGIVAHRGPATGTLRDTAVFATFSGPSWSATSPVAGDYAMIAAVDLRNGLTWYLARIDGVGEALHISQVYALRNASGGIDVKDLHRIEQAAVEKVATITIQRNFAQAGISLKHTADASTTSSQRHDDSGFALPFIFDPNTFLVPNKKEASVFSVAGSLDLVRPVKSSLAGLGYQCRLSLHDSISRKVTQHLHRSLRTDNQLQVGKEGQVQVNLTIPLNSSAVASLRDRLRSLADLCSYVEVLSRNHFAIANLSGSRVRFVYAPGLTCSVRLGGDSDAPLLEFGHHDRGQPEKDNPHARISKQLETVFTSSALSNPALAPSTVQISNLCQVLVGTLPIMECGQTFEQRDPVCRCLLHCHDALTYRLIYHAPLPKLNLSIKAMIHQGRLSWTVRVLGSGLMDERIRSVFAQMWKDRGNGWIGMRSGAVATVRGLAVLLEHVDQAVRRHEGGSQPVQQAKQVQPQQAKGSAQPPRSHNAHGNQNNRAKAKGHEVVVLD